MRVLLLMFSVLLFRGVLFGQALMDFDYPILDNTMAFWGDNYDSALLRKNKVESCVQKNQSFYFDHNGRLVKSILIPPDSATQVRFYHYDSIGDLIKIEATDPRLPKPTITTKHKTYVNGVLIKDSSSSGYFCRHMDYYENGGLKQELWFGPDPRYKMGHRLQRGFWFGVDSAGRINRIIDRDYMGTMDSLGQLLSNRTLFYNERGQLIREEETVRWKETEQKTLFCPNAGSANFQYDTDGRIIEISRTNGPSQKIKYLPNGLIAEIETEGKMCEGRAYQWKWTYDYTYRK